MKDSLAIYKLIVLYMLDKVEVPLTKAQIYDFVLQREYTNYMTLQTAMAELQDMRMVTAESYRNRTHLKLTDVGRETIQFFGKDINENIRKDIDEYFNEMEVKLKNELSIVANYDKSTETGEWEAHLVAQDKGVKLIDITMSVPIEETAAEICDNWSKKNQEIYQYLVKQLF